MASGALQPNSGLRLMNTGDKMTASDQTLQIQAIEKNASDIALNTGTLGNPAGKTAQGINGLRLYKSGRTVNLMGSGTTAVAFDTGAYVDVATIPAGYRPPIDAYFQRLVVGTGINTVTFRVTAAGVISMRANTVNIPTGWNIDNNLTWVTA